MVSGWRVRRVGAVVCAVLLWTVFGVSIAAAQSAWSDEMYDEYTYASFENFGPANERVDFEAIDYPLLHAAVFYETNRQRDRFGYPVFGHSPALEEAAWEHSRDMVSRDFFSHTSPIASKRSMSMRLEAVGIRNVYAAENIAITFGIEYEAGRGVYSPQQNGGFFSYEYKGDPIESHTYLGVARAVVDQWMNSPGHRANILNGNYTYMGAGGAYFPDTGFYDMAKFKFTQNFASVRG